jgi:hypothetical protein
MKGAPSKLGAIIFWRDFGKPKQKSYPNFRGIWKSLQQSTPPPPINLEPSYDLHSTQSRMTPMTDNETMADVLELLLLNQQAIVAGLEEVALWIEARGSLETHDNIVTALATLDTNAGGITAAIEKLRQNHQ